MNNNTEPIVIYLNSLKSSFSAHPLFRAARDSKLNRPLLEEFAFHQYCDSILWVPMLSLMKEKCIKSTRLRNAIEDNIKCETGIGSTSHTEMARLMMRSLNLKIFKGFPEQTFQSSATRRLGDWLSDEFESFTEPAIAGWLLTAETLVPMMFAEVAPAYRAIPGCQTQYFDEHIDVDSDEHSVWMKESAQEIIELYGTDIIPTIQSGMLDAYNETCEIPNQMMVRFF